LRRRLRVAIPGIRITGLPLNLGRDLRLDGLAQALASPAAEPRTDDGTDDGGDHSFP
jgi:hypothetical protein